MNQIPGQQQLQALFRRLIRENRLPHAMLIQSQEGGSGLALARYVSALLMCDSPTEEGPCGVCASCIKTTQNAHPDVHFSYPVNTNKKNKDSKKLNSESYLSEWKEINETDSYFTLLDWYRHIDIENKQGFIGKTESTLLRSKLALRAFEGGYRVFIIWQADRMNPEFGNKMLKSLEEPTPKTIFILVSEKPNELLTTILSRVQLFQEEHIDEHTLAAYLTERLSVSEGKAHDIAFRSEGNLSHAIKEARHEGESWLDDFKMWMRLAYMRDLVGLYSWSEKMAAKSRDSERQFIAGALKVIDRCFRMGWVQIDIPMEGEEAKFYNDFSPFINASNVQGFLELLQETSFHIERNVNEKLVWYDTSIKAIRLVHTGKKSVAATE